MSPFIIYALPRSRTFWVSRFLSYGAWECGHDEMPKARSLEDVRAWFGQPCIGTVETGAACWWRIVQQTRPDIRTITIRRPVAQVLDSLMQTGVAFDKPKMVTYLMRMDAKLDQIERRVSGVLSVSYEGLVSEQSCAALFEHCLPYQHDHTWWQAMASLNLQKRFDIILRYYRAFEPQLLKLSEIAKRVAIANMAPRKVVEKDDITIQQELCESWYRDGKRLFEEHSIELGEGPDGYMKRNWPLMKAMDKTGGMQIVAARCNGRMVGYYVCYIAPATDDAALTSAMHISIFVTKDFTGIGPRLQRYSIEELRKKGVGEINFRAGINADGPRMGAIYQRAGAELIGQMYRLSLKAA